MDRRFTHTSSLARKFFDDFPDAQEMPLSGLSPPQQRLYAQHLEPLLELSGPACTLPRCLAAVEQLMAAFDQPHGHQLYCSVRRVADYLQAVLALCLVDAAGALASHPDSASFAASLRSLQPELYAALLHEELRRRLVANGLGQAVPGSLLVSLSDYPPYRQAILCVEDADFMIVSEPPWEAYAHVRRATPPPTPPPHAAAPATAAPAELPGAASPAPARGPWQPYAALQPLVAAARHRRRLPPPGTLLRANAWKRQLQRGSSHYLLPLLGKDEGGCVVLSGACVPRAIAGAPPAAATEPAGPGAEDAGGLLAAAGGGGGGSAGAVVAPEDADAFFLVSFVGYPDAAAAGRALHNCLAEVLTRYRARHPTPPTGRHQPLAVASQHHLLLLLPEGSPSGAAGAATHEAAIAFDLTLHVDLEALLLAAPDPLCAWAWDGSGVWSTPRGLRALCSRALVIDPATLSCGGLADGALLLQPLVTGETGDGLHCLAPQPRPAAATAAPAAEAAAAPRAAAAAAGDQGPAGVAAAAARLQALAAAGWQPVLLAAPCDPSAALGPAAAPAAAAPLDDLTGSLPPAPAADYQGVVRALQHLEALMEQQQQQQQGQGAATVAPAAAAARGSPKGTWSGVTHASQLLQRPQLLRQLLDHAPASGPAPAPAPAGAGALGQEALPAGQDLDPVVQQRLRQLLRGQYAWSWRHLELQREGAAAEAAEELAGAAGARWWRGELMRGCVLREDAAA